MTNGDLLPAPRSVPFLLLGGVYRVGGLPPLATAQGAVLPSPARTLSPRAAREHLRGRASPSEVVGSVWKVFRMLFWWFMVVYRKIRGSLGIVRPSRTTVLDYTSTPSWELRLPLAREIQLGRSGHVLRGTAESIEVRAVSSCAIRLRLSVASG